MRLLLALFALSFVSALLPLVNAEALLAWTATQDAGPLMGLAAVAAIGQVLGKLLWYYAGMRTIEIGWMQRKLAKSRSEERLARWQAATRDKPRRSMRGRSGVLHTGHSLHDTGSGHVAAATASTTVHFADLTDDEIAAYVATGEPLQVAGAFTVDGLGGAFVTGIEGDHHNVVGLSLPLLRDLLAELGHSWTELWSASTGAARST